MASELTDDSIQRAQDGETGRYSLPVGNVEAELTYRVTGDVMVIDHTFTPPHLRGQGLASRLMARAVQDARQEGMKIRPVCPYASRWFAAHAEEKDVLA